MSGILVVGSVNADIILKVGRLPLPGETMSASDDSGNMVPGGKGANQAVAASNLGARVSFAGMFGSDSHASTLRQVMETHKVDITLSQTAVDTPSGQAYILLQDGGENSIIIVGGANAAWPSDLSGALLQGISQAQIILLQREVPDRINVAVASAARAAGVPVIMDVGGRAGALPAELLPLISVLSPNETELARLLGVSEIGDSDAEIEAAARRLQQETGVGNVLIKLGSRGSMWVPVSNAAPASSSSSSSSSPAFSIEALEGAQQVLRQCALKVDHVVDTTGAGDCFTASFAVGLQCRWPIATSMRFASAAAAICIQRLGAIPSLPFRQEVDALLMHQA